MQPQLMTATQFRWSTTQCTPRLPIRRCKHVCQAQGDGDRMGRVMNNIETSRMRLKSIIETAEKYGDSRPVNGASMDRVNARPPSSSSSSGWEDDTRRTWSNEFYAANEAIRQEQERFGREFGGRPEQQGNNWAASAASLLSNAASAVAKTAQQNSPANRPPAAQQSDWAAPVSPPPQRYSSPPRPPSGGAAPTYPGVAADPTSFEWLVLVAAAVAVPVVVASEYSIASTACCGLPRGPFGLLGGLEALSYLTVMSVIGWSLFRRALRGEDGLPAGPLGLLPVAEGLSYAAAVGFLFVITVQILGNGWVPGPLAPVSPCF